MTVTLTICPGAKFPDLWSTFMEGSLPSSETFSIANVVGTSEEFYSCNSLDTVLPTRSVSKSISYWSKVMKGYFPIALTLNTLVTSVAPSASFTIIVAIITLASSDINVTVTSFFCLGPRVPKSIAQIHITNFSNCNGVQKF